jgi:gluconate 2-dehydrogenase gamma chain
MSYQMSEEINANGRERFFFDEHQWMTIEAAMSRIIPTDEHPGAKEAGTVEFLDRYLSGIGFVYAKPDGSGFEQLEGKRAEAWRRRIKILREKYVEGIEALDRRSKDRFGVDFVRLTAARQDVILAEMERLERQTEADLEQTQATAAWAPVEPAMQQTSAEIELDFFLLLALHTRQGFYADPIYGGNRERVGWKLIGFDGPKSLVETHSGRYTTLPYFAEEQIEWGEEGGGGA